MKCTQCSVDMALGDQFCGNCGTPRQVTNGAFRPGPATGDTCGKCGVTLRPEERFCGKCGYPAPENVKPQMHDEPLPFRAAPNDALAQAARTLLLQGRKIQAIKLVRERTGCGLKEAKDFVESL
jgi:predicted amidophosphoribosyltransferase